MYSATSTKLATAATLAGALLMPIDMKYGLLLLNYAAIQYQLSRNQEMTAS